MARSLKNSLVFALSCASLTFAAPVDRIAAPIDPSHSVVIPNHVRHLAAQYRDDGPLPASQHLDGLTLYLKPSASQKMALDRLLVELHDPASPRYHQWLTPEEYADRFAITPADAAKIAAWLESQGFRVGAVGRGRSYIVFEGTAGAAEAAFHAGLHRFISPLAVHFANTANPTIPQALADIVGAVGGLDDFLPEPDQRQARPAYDNGNGTYSLAPGDLAVIYDFASLLASGIDGTGQSIVVAGQSDIVLSDFQDWGQRYNLPAPKVQVIVVPGYPDPGITSSMSEADLDIQSVAGVAVNATILFVNSTSAYTALTYAIDQDLAPVVNVSFHVGCDASNTAAFMNSYRTIAQQGIALGITWVNSSGDIGAAGCDANGETVATKGLNARFPADIPEVTAVGGTEFNEQSGKYWASSNNGYGVSALSYIPEIVWNDTALVGEISASTGGVSTFFAKPDWQSGPGVPNDGQRDIPDVSVTASSVHDAYPFYTNGVLKNGGGTSGSSPLFAGMVVLLNQYLVAQGAQLQPGVGNLNILLYRLAQSNPSAFHDVTVGNNIVPCTIGTPDCTTGTMGYTAGPGYDLCTGLGSVDLTKLVIASVGKCGVTGIGPPNIVAAQQIINEALGAATPVHDLNGDGVVNVADLRILMNATLGLGCEASM